MLTVNSTINLAGQAVPNIIPAVQGDTGRVIVFTLADFTIPAGSTATYYVQKPSGEAVYNAATINDNKVTVELTAQSLAETGDNYGQVRILNGEDVVTSFDFILLVKPFRGIGSIESTTEMNIFDEAVQNAMEQFDSMLPDIIAPEFDSSTAYEVGDYVIYGGKLYQFTTDHAAGAWTGTDAEETTVAENLGGGSGLIITDYDPDDIYLWDDGTIIATGITLNKNTMTFSDVGSQSITATLIPSNAQETITWASSDESVATVSGNGNTATVTAVGNGSATITATTDTTQLSASCAVTASGLPEEGVRYRFTGADCTTETSQVVGGAAVTFKSAPTIEEGGVLIAENNYMMIENAENWFSGDWTIEIIFEPRFSSAVLGSASSQTLLDAKYGNLYDGTSSNQGQALQIQNPRDTGLLSYGGTNSSLDIRPYNNTECVIKIQHSTSANGAVYFNGTQVVSKGNNATIPSNKNIYFNAFNKSASKFAHVLKSFVIRDGVV